MVKNPVPIRTILVGGNLAWPFGNSSAITGDPRSGSWRAALNVNITKQRKLGTRPKCYHFSVNRLSLLQWHYESPLQSFIMLTNDRQPFPVRAASVDEYNIVVHRFFGRIRFGAGTPAAVITLHNRTKSNTSGVGVLHPLEELVKFPVASRCQAANVPVWSTVHPQSR